MNIKPLGERVLVERLEEDTKTASGIIIPDNAKEKPLMGVIKAVGSEVKEVKVRYKIDTHDYEVRIKSVRKFIAQGNKVKIVVMLRGREMQHSNLAFDLANKFMEDLVGDTIAVEKKPQLEGRNVTLFLAPV